jgi:hypothetical protein
MFSGLKLDADAMKKAEGVDAELRRIAGSIARQANQTSAKIGITYRRNYRGRGDDVYTIVPAGAAAIPVEFGSFRTPAKRYVKRALDAHRIS